MKDYSVELCHIYTNSEVDKQHAHMRNILKPLLNGYAAENNTYSVVIMVDDYTFPDPRFDYDAFVLWFKTDSSPLDVLSENHS